MAAPDLAKLTADTEAKLREIHGEIGVTADETQARLQKLQEDIRQIFQSAIDGTQKEKQDLKDSVVSLTNEAQQIGEQLKEQADVEAKLQQLDRSSLRSNVSSLEKLIAALSEKKAKRQEVLQGFLDKLLPLYNELGISPPSPFDQLGTEFSTDKVSKFEAELKDIEVIKRQRVDEVGFLVSDISLLWNELCIAPADCTSELDQRILQSQNTTARTLGLSADTIVRLKARKEELDAEKHSRLAEIDRLSKLILPLWERLEVPDAEKRAFSASVNGISLDIIQKYRVELARLEELKLQKMGDLIRTARVQINALCDEMKISEEDRQMFKPAYMDVFTEQTLAMHEAEIVRLQERLQSIKVLLEMVAKRESYRQRIAASKVTSSDPNRFQRRDLAKILKEEEECKKLKDNGLPKLETKLMDEIKLWENAHNEPFMIDGCPFVEVILKDQEERRNEDAAKKIKKENHDGANVQAPPATPVKKAAATPAAASSAQRGGPRKA